MESVRVTLTLVILRVQLLGCHVVAEGCVALGVLEACGCVQAH